MDLLIQAWFTLTRLLHATLISDWSTVAMKFMPFVLLFEMPVQLAVMLGVWRYRQKQRKPAPPAQCYTPVSCVITCYSEGPDVALTIRSLTEQLYPGHIEMLAIVDGSVQNRATEAALRRLLPFVASRPNRRLIIVPKVQRGGRVSSLNQGLALARGQIIMAIDGDTSFDNDMVMRMARQFIDPNVVAVSGNLRVRNARASLWTRLQGLEYLISIHLSRTGLDQLNAVNNVSGAFGAFRRTLLKSLGGWDSGTAEDLDLTIRIKKYFVRHPNLRIRFEPRAVGHTDVPTTLWGFLNQRLRWDGDLSYLYFRKYRAALRPGLLGWTNFIAIIWTGLFFQIALPFVVISYMSWALFVYAPGFLLGVLALIYMFYALLTFIMYAEYMLLLSDRRREDLQFLWLVPLFPAFAFMIRVWSGVATLTELFTRSHLDSAMAPWWVLRRARY
jgi:cellulose synthase/poly-beta-1,6-N-acetylglucosamine synthase-like glycosyltransferase